MRLLGWFRRPPGPRVDRYSVVQVVQWNPPVYIVKVEGVTHRLAIEFMLDVAHLNPGARFSVVTDADVAKAERVGAHREPWMREWSNEQ